MFAIFLIGGKQYKVQEGDNIYVEKIDKAESDKVIFSEIMMVGSKIGTPYVNGASVSAKIVKHGKAKKIKIIKFHSKKHYMKRQGHRQPYTQLLIESIKA